MTTLRIYNCHIHIFTIKHVPLGFLPLGLGHVLQWKPMATAFDWLISRLAIGSRQGKLTRFARFASAGNQKSQEEIFTNVQRCYPTGTRFVILPMDMALMGAGEPAIAIEQQHQELIDLARRPAYKDVLIPFCTVDPRRPNAVELAKRWIEVDGFRGLKLYPRLGYSPQHERLMELYPLLEKKRVPIMTHCSSGPSALTPHGLTSAQAGEFGHPRHYEAILEQHPHLHLCLAHFGGSEEWDRQLGGEVEATGPQRTWVRWIRDLLESQKYPNLYTDVSMLIYQVMQQRRPIDYIDYLKVLLAGPAIREHVLYGSDYYMMKLADMTEKEVSILLRSRLGEDLYFQIAHHNPRRYLNEKD